MGALRWRAPPREEVERGGFFEPVPIGVPTPAPRSGGLAPIRPLGPLPNDTQPLGYPPCTPDGQCSWEVYAPQVVNDPPLAEISTSGLAEVWHPVGPIALGKQTLLLANSTGTLLQSHDGASWESLCVAPAGRITGLAVRGEALLLLAQAEGRSHVHRGTTQRGDQPGCAWEPQAAQLLPLAPDAAVGDDGRSLTGIAVDPAGTVWVAVPNTQPGQASYATLYASATRASALRRAATLGGTRRRRLCCRLPTGRCWRRLATHASAA